MGIRIKSAPNFSKMKSDIQAALITELKHFAGEQLEEVKTRTFTRGVDANDAPFAPYTSKYQRFKNRHTNGIVSRNGKQQANAIKGVGSFARPNLILSGDMQRAVQSGVFIQGKKIVVKVFINGKDALKALGNMKKRKFFLISKKSEQDFRDLMSNFIGRRLK